MVRFPHAGLVVAWWASALLGASCSSSDGGGDPTAAGGGSAGGGAGESAGEATSGSAGTSNGVNGGESPGGASSTGGGMDSEGGASGASTCLESLCTPPSCIALDGSECAGGDCCASPELPGGTFQQGEPDAFASTVDDFRLDAFEVTVARFRQFVSAYDAWLGAGNPRAGAGEHARVPESGWRAEWTPLLAADGEALVASVQCGSQDRHSWAESGNDARPINCLDWYTAAAFCIWDGGRLPTEAETEYAAVAGERDDTYPWGNAPVLTDMQDDTAGYAVYLCLGDGSAPGACSAGLGDLPEVGSRPLGRGSYGHFDLVGSVWEWSLDWYHDDYPTTPQSNYANLEATMYRSMRGGTWDSTAKLTHSASRTGLAPGARYDTVGVRCARER